MQPRCCFYPSRHERRVAARAGDGETLFRVYERQLAIPQAREQLDELVSLARTGRRLCLLCCERDPAHCHRRRISELVSQRLRIKVMHLFCAPV